MSYTFRPIRTLSDWGRGASGEAHSTAKGSLCAHGVPMKRYALAARPLPTPTPKYTGPKGVSPPT